MLKEVQLFNNSVDTIITDIPYAEVNRENSGIEQLKNVDKGDADIITFDLIEFLKETHRIAKNNIIKIGRAHV